MQTGTIVRRNAGQFIPNEYLERLLAANPHGWGAAIVTEEEGEKKLLLNSMDEPLTLEFLQDTLKTFDKQDIVLYVCSSEGGLSKSDLSPHIIVVKKDGDEEIPQIVAFIDGNFPGYAKKDSSHPSEYHLAADYLCPKLEGMYEMADGDLDKVTEQMKKPFFRKELMLTSVSRGTITLVCANGTSLTFAQSDVSAEYPWGWVSNTHGYASASAKKEEVKTETKKSMFPSRSTVREKANVQPSAKIAEAVTPPKTGATVIRNYTVTKGRPPSHISRSERKDWYKTRIGYLPPTWEKCCEIEFYLEAGKLLTFSAVKKLGLDAAALPALKNPQRGEKDVETENIPQPEVTEREPAVTREVLPIMSPDTKKHITALMKNPEVQKIIAGNADMILDPAKVQGLEKKFADFATQVGAKSIDEFLMWDFGMFYELGKAKPDGLAVMAWTFRNILAYHRTKEVKKEVTEQLKDPNKKPSMFPSRKAAAA